MWRVLPQCLKPKAAKYKKQNRVKKKHKKIRSTQCNWSLRDSFVFLCVLPEYQVTTSYHLPQRSCRNAIAYAEGKIQSFSRSNAASIRFRSASSMGKQRCAKGVRKIPARVKAYFKPAIQPSNSGRKRSRRN